MVVAHLVLLREPGRVRGCSVVVLLGTGTDSTIYFGVEVDCTGTRWFRVGPCHGVPRRFFRLALGWFHRHWLLSAPSAWSRQRWTRWRPYNFVLAWFGCC